MPYATLQNLIDRCGSAMLVGLTDRAEVPTGTIDIAVVNRALASADALIDGYLAGRYALPLAVVPPLLTQLAEAIAVWNLHTTEPEAKVAADYEAAIKRLVEIARGTIQLKDAAGTEPAAPGEPGVQITDRDRMFTPDTMTGFI